MKTMKWLLPILPLYLLLHACSSVSLKPCTIINVKKLEPANHPQLCYLFFSSDVLENDKVYRLLDTVANRTPYTFVFLTARSSGGRIANVNDMNFHDTARFRPIMQKVVAYAHKIGLKIGLQLWARSYGISIEDAERVISEGEIRLDNQGRGVWTGKPVNVRAPQLITESKFLGAYSFSRKGDGYKEGTVKDISSFCQVETYGKDSVTVRVDCGAAMAGMTAYVMAQHVFSYCTNTHQKSASENFVKTLEGYRGIPFDGTALDEDGNLPIRGGAVRFYGKEMDVKYRKATGVSLQRGLFDMRYAPEGNESQRIRAINTYMDIVRSGPVIVDSAFYKASKEIFGPNTFAGIHNTFHNNIDEDEIWRTGFKWWSVQREYAQTDEHTPLEVQLGGAFARPMNAAYNQFYNKSAETIAKKALDDLRYGVRTHFHAVNDPDRWGISLENPQTLSLMEPVERCARLLNRFNPALPEVRTLIIFGSEAIANPYPDATPNQYGVRPLGGFEKAEAVRKAGILTALVPSDLIKEGVLKLEKDGKPVMNGHVFESVIFLNPQHAPESVWKFLEGFTAAGGKLMLEGNATHDFTGRDVRVRFEALKAKSTVVGFNLDKLSGIGAVKNIIPDGCCNGDGSYVFTDYSSLDPANPAHTQTFETGGLTYTFDYRGLAAILVDVAGLKKFSARDFSELKQNGKTILRLTKPSTVELVREKNKFLLTIEGESVQPVFSPH